LKELVKVHPSKKTKRIKKQKGEKEHRRNREKGQRKGTEKRNREKRGVPQGKWSITRIKLASQFI
jgi:hypothetical protein